MHGVKPAAIVALGSVVSLTLVGCSSDYLLAAYGTGTYPPGRATPRSAGATAARGR
jgi:hypothetical protein